MALATSQILAILQVHGYIYMFLLMFVESVTVNYAAAFAASAHILNIYIVFIIALFGNISADLLYFFIGKKGKKMFIQKYIRRVIGDKRMERITDSLKKHPGRTIAIIKLTPLIPVPGIMLCGASELKATKFISYSFFISFLFVAFITLLGFYSGSAFLSIAKGIKYVELLILGAVIIILVFWLLYRFISRRIAKSIGKI